MAAATTRFSIAGSHNGRELITCPMCGQPLLDHDAIERVEHAQDELDRKVESAIQVKAAQLAKQIAKRERDVAEKTIATLTAQLATDRDAAGKLKSAHAAELAKQKAAHAEELRTTRVKVRTEITAKAEKYAAAKVRTDLLKKDGLISTLREQNEAQQRRIEHLTSDERGEMNEDELVSALQSLSPTTASSGSVAGGLGRTSCTRCASPSATRPRSPG